MVTVTVRILFDIKIKVRASGSGVRQSQVTGLVNRELSGCATYQLDPEQTTDESWGRIRAYMTAQS